MEVLVQLFKLGAYKTPVFIPEVDESTIREGLVAKKENGYVLTEKGLRVLASIVGKSVRSILSTGTAVLVTAYILTRKRGLGLFSVKEVSEALGISQPAAVMTLRRLAKSGKVKKLVRGGYVLTPVGVTVARRVLEEVKV